MSGEAKFISDKYIQVLETNLNFIEKELCDLSDISMQRKKI